MNFTFTTGTSLESARLIRKAYIDSLISSMIRLETDPHVVVWIDKLRGCRNRDWDEEVRDTIRNAILTYNTRWGVVYGGGITLGKFLGKVADGALAAISGKDSQDQGKIGTVAHAVTKGFVDWQRTGQTGGSSEAELRNALNTELQRLESYSV